ncbi:MAG: hypothetical protein QOJ35_3250 [Solirubrobacteraceae bacterium]|jgi:hypothetical protein|nr:hypothetical protein [Solirubrobacteraceae bacterium]
MKFSKRMRAATALVACAAVGAAGGIAGSAAAPSKSASAKPSALHRMAGRMRVGLGPGRAVHAERVVLNKAGDAFITETEDSGKVKAVSGSDVTITEAIGSVTYKDVTLTIPSGATIVRNGKSAAVGDLQAGDRIHVSQSSDGTFAFAADATFRPRLGRGPGGPGGPGDRDGPHPGGPWHP